MNAQPQEAQDLIADLPADQDFVEIQAATRAEAERAYGAVFDQDGEEINHG